MRHTGAAIGLNGAVEHVQQHRGHLDLDFGDLLERVLGVGLVDLDGGVEHGKSGRVDLDAGFGHSFEHDAVLGQLFAEWSLGRVVEAGDEVFECFFGLQFFLIVE